LSTVSDFAPDRLHASVQNLVILMRSQLDELVRRKADLGRRRRKLLRLRHRLLCGARRSPGYGAGALKSSRLRNYVKRASAGARKFQRLHNNLRRACRIAFVEVGGVATPDQIYSLIVRRCSFSFIDVEAEPADAIVHTLNVMAKAGEVQCLTSDPNSAWKFVHGEQTDRKY
jgi:hypothetical protein